MTFRARSCGWQARGFRRVGVAKQTAVEWHHVVYGKHRIDFAVVRRRRKTLEIAVEPDASVVVAAPLDAPIEAIAEKVRKRAAWIRGQQRFFSQFMPRTPERRYLAGETHLYLGRQYRLKVVRRGRPGVEMVRGFIIVHSREPDRPEVTRRLVDNWYRKQARAKFAERLEASLARFPDPAAFRPRGLIVRRMEKRWGSLSPSGRLLLNRRLIEAPGRHDRLRDRARTLPHGGAASWGGVLPTAGPGHAGLGGAEGAVGGEDGLRTWSAPVLLRSDCN